MKNFSMELSERPKTSVEQLSRKVSEMFRSADTEIAVEIYSEVHGIAENVSTDQLKQAEAETHAGYRSRLAAMLDGLSFQSEVLSIYDAFAAGEKSAKEAATEVEVLLLASAEQNSEIEAASRQLKDFIEQKLTSETTSRAEKSKWGFAKLDYEKGNPDPLLAAVTQELGSSDDQTTNDLLRKFINFLKHQKSALE